VFVYFWFLFWRFCGLAAFCSAAAVLLFFFSTARRGFAVGYT